MSRRARIYRPRAESRGARLLATLVLLLPLGLAGGCFDVGPGGPRPGGDDGTTAPDAGDGDTGEPPDGEVTPPTVRLTASNVTPQPNEELQLVCEVTAGSSAGVSFDFAPDLGRLIVDRQRGTAGLVIQDVDVGIAYSFTCMGTNSAGTGPASNTIVVFAMDLIGPAPGP